MICLKKTTWSNAGGFTLVELLVALAVASIFIVATLTIADVSIHTYSTQERVAEAQQSLRAALDLMARDIRMAGYDPMSFSYGPTTGIGIIAASNTLLQFSADLNADRIDNGGVENMTYFYDAHSNRLRQEEGGRAYPQTFIENVSEMRFDYFDANGDPTANLEQIVTVVVTLSVEYKDDRGDAFERSGTARINCRNLRMRGRQRPSFDDGGFH
jgi:type IV pilus assembly protein PilW